ncbi:MAG: insulinase family protein [Myxococcales bacterium]|nr:insulinase family protein [Myxococcales bacterium]
MKCILEPSFDTPLVSFHISNRVGTAAEPRGLEGMICHTAEMGFRGAGFFGRDQFDEKVDGLGAGLGIGTRRDYLTMRGTCLLRHLDSLFELAVSTMHLPRFEREEHEQLLRETRYELDDLRDDDASLAHRFLNRYMHPGYVYCRTALGTKASLEKLDLEECKTLHAQLFRHSDLVLGIAGPVDEDRLAQLGARIPQHSEPLARETPKLDPPAMARGRRLVIVDKPGREQCQVAMGHLAPVYGTDAHDHMQVAEAAFGGMFTSRLMQEIRVKEGWSYGANCSMHRARGSRGWQMTMAPSADVCPKAIARTLELFSELHEAGLSENEFNFTRSYLQGSAAFERSTANQRLFRSIQEEVYDLPNRYADNFSDRLDAMDVAQVNEAIGAHTHPGDLCVVVVATAPTMQAPLEALGWDSVEVVAYDSY